jgi:predicted lipoprotein with Yx(FWY)xxD motif
MHRVRFLTILAGFALVVTFAPRALAAPSGQSAPLVQVATNPTLGSILVNSKGLTLYSLSSETGGNIQCTGSCLQAWPPLLLPSGTTAPTAGPGVTGTLAVITRPDGGQQVTYNGLPVYMFSGDSKPGDTNGEGIPDPPGTWHVVKVSAAAPGPGTTPSQAVTAAFPPQAAANPKLGTIMVDAQGRTLYILTAEAGAHLACTGKCLSVWPPLLWPSGAAAPHVAGFSGTFGSVPRPDGSLQVTFNSLPLYIFSKDSAPGDTNGEGIKAFGGVWHAATPNLVPLSAAPAARLTVRITTTGATVWGKVTVHYQSGGRAITRTCAASSCRFAVPVGARVRFSQSPTNTMTWPFESWRIRAGGRTRTLMKSAPAVTIRGNSTVTAVYVVA